MKSEIGYEGNKCLCSNFLWHLLFGDNLFRIAQCQDWWKLIQSGWLRFHFSETFFGMSVFLKSIFTGRPALLGGVCVTFARHTLPCHAFHTSPPVNHVMKLTRLRVVDNSELGKQAMLEGKPPYVIHVYTKTGIGTIGESPLRPCDGFLISSVIQSSLL